MHIRVLGAAAGGGFPQWNCGCANCRDARAGHSDLIPLTQECVAVSADGERWFLLNASPEIRSQIEGFAPLHPKAERHSPIAGIILTNGDLDHTLGLLSLRESHPLVVYSTHIVRDGFTERNSLYKTLERFPGQVTWETLVPGRAAELAGGLAVEAVPAPGKPPVHLENAAAAHVEQNVGVLIHDRGTGKRLAYFSAAGAITREMKNAFDQADCLFFDGTFWSSDELVALKLGTKRAEDMAHVPVGGPGGSLAQLGGLRTRERIYIHVNNTNPMLRRGSPERREVEARGWRIAADGMELQL